MSEKLKVGSTVTRCGFKLKMRIFLHQRSGGVVVGGGKAEMNLFPCLMHSLSKQGKWKKREFHRMAFLSRSCWMYKMKKESESVRKINIETDEKEERNSFETKVSAVQSEKFRKMKILFCEV